MAFADHGAAARKEFVYRRVACIVVARLDRNRNGHAFGQPFPRGLGKPVPGNDPLGCGHVCNALALSIMSTAMLE
jgi:hypothetical protein